MLGEPQGKKNPSILSCRVLYNGVQLFEQATDVQRKCRWRSDGEASGDVSACRLYPPPASTSPQSSLVGQPQEDLSWPSNPIGDLTGGLLGQHSQGLGTYMSSLQAGTW